MGLYFCNCGDVKVGAGDRREERSIDTCLHPAAQWSAVMPPNPNTGMVLKGLAAPYGCYRMDSRTP